MAFLFYSTGFGILGSRWAVPRTVLCPKVLPTEGAVDLGSPSQEGRRIRDFSVGQIWKTSKNTMGPIRKAPYLSRGQGKLLLNTFNSAVK